MFLSIALYFIFLFLIWWSFCGYVFIIYLLSLFKGRDRDIKLTSYSSVAIVIACYNEENLVQQKVDNLRLLDYPQDKLSIYFLDGMSTDKTVVRLNELIKDTPNMKVIQTNCNGKIKQLNYFLPQIQPDIIVNSDMDALVQPQTLVELMKEFQKDKDVYVVGAFVTPQNCIDLEKHYWETQNSHRVAESRVYASSAVMASCYAYRRGLLEKFPDDCVADDIYISYLANSQNKKTKYSDSTIVYETRCPSNLEELMSHKFRKANAYIEELLRFSYLLPKMSNSWKVIYLTKMLQILFMPWILIFFLLSSISFLLSGHSTVKVVMFAFIFLLASFLLVHYFVQKSRKQLTDFKFNKSLLIVVFLLTNLILFFAGITYPFFSQSSRYKRLEQ